MAISNKDIQKQFNVLRRNLLDLSMRNQLLNFKPRKTVIEVVDEISTEIYEILVLKEQKMEFLPIEEEGESDIGEVGQKEDVQSKLSEEETDLLWELPPPDVEVDDRHKDNLLQTELNSKELQKRLFRINQQANSVFEEQGYNILYLALGVLEWNESSYSNKMYKAPLILIPVHMQREGVKRSFKINYNDDDILTNISLKAKLNDQGIVLPDFEMPEDKSGIYNYFEKVKELTAHMDGWNVQNNIYLGFFSFSKFVMYQDLDMENWPDEFTFQDSPIINELFNPSEYNNEAVFDPESVDDSLSFKNTYTVLDADSSQIAVIEDAKSGKNLVVEGPPGTGKSQTIVNLIAELMASGKTVLFVSEKMAALEVVKSRLDSIGLGNFCLELHSKHSNKKKVLDELKRTLKYSESGSFFNDNKFDELDHIKLDLNDYARRIHQPFGKMKFTPYHLYGMKEEAIVHFESKEKEIPIINIENYLSYNYDDLKGALNKLNDMSKLLKVIQPILKHPWRFCHPETIIPTDMQEIKSLLGEIILNIDQIQEKTQNISNEMGISLPFNLEEIDEELKISTILTERVVEDEVLSNPDWDFNSKKATLIISNLEEYRKKQPFLSKFSNDILDKDINSILEHFKGFSEKKLRIISGDYRKTKKTIESFYNKKPVTNDDGLITDLNELITCQELRNVIRESKDNATDLFGSKWLNENTDPENLKELSQWLLQFRILLNENKINAKAIEVVSKGIDPSIVKTKVNDIQIDVDKFLQKFNSLYSYLKLETTLIFETDLNHIELDKIKSQMGIYQSNLESLTKWSHFLHQKDELPPISLGLKKFIDNDEIDPDDLIPILKGNLADSLLKEVFQEELELRNFMADLHENKIKKFTNLDLDLLRSNRSRISQKISANKPVAYASSANSEMGILQKEFQRKRRHMPIRKLLTYAGGLIQTIKPCFMMSPLSIAQFIEPEAVSNLIFDVVIFDEASQVKPEDALGAFLRGKQIIVMGDTKQLPPTSFFDIMVQTSEETVDYDMEALEDMESVLHLCKLSFPTKTLRWHYRSRHESLIAVSNQEFYDNYLFIYPSPHYDSQALGLQFVHVEDGIYDKGTSSINLEEAKAVVNAAFQHYNKYGYNKSLGIATFNTRQQQAIFEILELELKRNPNMEEYFSSTNKEHFFVKNLETIQGDERDVIMISVGFGFDNDHKLSQNFGPLNREGGERRLNVLVTRAKEKCVVFSNFKYSDLRVGADSPKGLKSLKVFMEYAETRKLVQIQKTGEDFDSPFEESVYTMLKSFNYEVEKQVGCAGYRIDLAVVDPASPGKYILGIECDGATYHSSPVARDRDRLRQQILEGLGWNIYRIWSTDWYKNRPDSLKRLLKAIEESKKPKAVISEKEEDEVIQEPPNEVEEYEFSETIIESPEIAEFEANKSLEDLIPPYELCRDLAISKNCEIHEKPIRELAAVVNQIVEFEGPIHIDEVVRRIRTYWGLKRAGRRIKEVITDASVHSQRNGDIFMKSDFLYYSNSEIIVRRRIKDPAPKIDLISYEEIQMAMMMVIKNQYATEGDELITQVSRLFGFKSTRSNTYNKINSVLLNALDSGELIKMPNGMINIPK